MSHILLIHQAFVSPSEGGGTRHYELAERLVKSGQQFTIIASSLNYSTGRRATEQDRKLVHEENIGGVRVLRAYTYPALHRSFVWRFLVYINFMITSLLAAFKVKKVDVVFGTSPPIFQSVSSWFIAFLRRKPFVLEIRDLWPDFAIELGVLKNPVLIWLSRMLERFLYWRATHVVVNSPAYRDYLLDKGLSDTKITVIPNGVDTTMFDPAADGQAIRQEYGLEGKFVVVYAGALGLANNIDVLLGAADLLRDDPSIHILLVGDGKERPNLEAQARDLDLPNVTFAGSRPKSEIPAMLAAANAGVAIVCNIPMFRTVYPNKVFDYMAAGRPTLLAIDGVIREVIERSQGGLFVPQGDSAAMADAIRKLSGDPALAEAMGQSARAYVVKHFDRDHHAAQFKTLFNNLTGETQQ